MVREDYQANILPVLQHIRTLGSLEVKELGADTGRFTVMLAPLVRQLVALDASRHKLQVTQCKLKQSDLTNGLLSA